MNKTAAISLKVLELIANGQNAIDALKTICGETAVDEMITDLYHQLRAKANQ